MLDKIFIILTNICFLGIYCVGTVWIKVKTRWGLETRYASTFQKQILCNEQYPIW